jgi:hypothetical protein
MAWFSTEIRTTIVVGVELAGCAGMSSPAIVREFASTARIRRSAV